MRVTAALALALSAGSAWAQPCATGWSDHFGTGVLSSSSPGASPPIVNAQLRVLSAFLVIGGRFDHAGGAAANSIALWTGSSFDPMAGGVTTSGSPGIVNALASFDPGVGHAWTFVGGWFSQAGGVPAPNLAAWDGSAWHAIPGTPPGMTPSTTMITNLAVADPDGDGPLGTSLIVSLTSAAGLGPFPTIGELWAWDGTAWTNLSGPSQDSISSIALFGAGSPSMYYTGSFLYSQGCSAISNSHLTRQDPAGPAALLSSECTQQCGDPPCPSTRYSQAIVYGANFTSPTMPRLVLSGTFDSVFGIAAHNLAAFDGTTWTQFGGGADGINRLFALNDPQTGPSLYAAGHHFTVAGSPVLALARYDVYGWTALRYGMTGTATSMVSMTIPGSIPAIYVGGVTNAGVDVPGWSRLTPWGWAPIGQCLNNEVHALASFAPAGQPASLYAGGAFTTAAGQLAVSLARWDGAQWHELFDLNNHVDCMAADGQYLAIGGKFTLDNLPTGGIALYDGEQLLRLGTGMNTPVHALAWFKGQLYAGGEFTVAGGTPAIGIAHWTGLSWSPLGAGTDNHVDALAVFDDGTGPALYAGGKFTGAGGQPAPHLARWTGSDWSPTPAGGADGNIAALTVLDDGSGPALYLGGDFEHVGSIAASRIARYRAGAFSALASNVDGTVRALSTLDPDGSGPLPAVLVAGGDFTHIDSTAASHGAIWNGRAWEPLNLNAPVRALAPFQSPGSAAPAMYFGGSFTAVDGIPTTFIADYARCACYANCDASTTPPVLNVNDFVCFLNLFAAGSTAANCDGSTIPPTLNVGDVVCFLNAFASGCPQP